ncbi:hypothetical protein C4J81_18705 (plasmid) [Deltaproteobacteria bacterium Smac51]|nr:hypothetical protein C4J81_18705 [Deltaproteobacteria bacterium Smac51]
MPRKPASTETAPKGASAKKNARPEEVEAPAEGAATRPLGAVFTPAPDQTTHYRPLLQGRGTNQLSRVNARKDAAVDPVTGEAVIRRGRNFTVFIEKFNHLTGGLRVSTHKLLDLCAMSLTGQNEYRGRGPLATRVEIHLDDYMRHCGIPMTKPSRDKTRLKVKEDLDALYHTSIEWQEPKNGKFRDFAKMRLITFQGIRNGRIMVNFSEEMAAYLTQAYIMQYPLALLAVSEKNPNAYALGKRLIQHYSQNRKRFQNGPGIISVRRLLEAAPEIPGHEEVAQSGRQYDQRIKEPFEKALAALPEILTWSYARTLKESLSPQETAGLKYQEFRQLYIIFQPVKLPPDTAGPESENTLKR